MVDGVVVDFSKAFAKNKQGQAGPPLSQPDHKRCINILSAECSTSEIRYRRLDRLDRGGGRHAAYVWAAFNKNMWLAMPFTRCMCASPCLLVPRPMVKCLRGPPNFPCSFRIVHLPLLRLAMWLALQCSLTVVGTRVGILLFDHFTHPIQLGQAGLYAEQSTYQRVWWRCWPNLKR